jgi:hypothetical protein
LVVSTTCFPLASSPLVMSLAYFHPAPLNREKQSSTKPFVHLNDRQTPLSVSLYSKKVFVCTPNAPPLCSGASTCSTPSCDDRCMSADKNPRVG